MDFTKHNVRV